MRRSMTLLVSSVCGALLCSCTFPGAEGSSRERPKISWQSDGSVNLSRAEYVELLKASDAAVLYKRAYESLLRSNTYQLTATAYNATEDQCGSRKGVTATGTKVHQGRTVAVSRDLRHLLGRSVRIESEGQDYGVFVVEDLMAAGKTRQVDIYMNKEQDAQEFGHRKVALIPL